MTTTHTPGPWFADKLQDRNAYNIFPAGATYALLTVAAPAHDGAHPYGQATEANARLIAAAPDLLAALQGLLQGIIRHEVKEEYLKHYPEVAAARAAIAAATGEA